MTRSIAMSLALVFVFALVCLRSAEAGPISRNNPYRSFNLTGVNYASMQWEKKYGNKASKNWSNGRSSGRWFRRR